MDRERKLLLTVAVMAPVLEALMLLAYYSESSLKFPCGGGAGRNQVLSGAPDQGMGAMRFEAFPAQRHLTGKLGRLHMSFAFSCTKCGKCCKSGGPALSIDEVFKYQDVFIAGLCWTAYSVSDQHFSTGPGGAYVPSEALRDHFSSLCGALTQPGDGDTHHPFIYPSVTGYDMAPGHGCTALNEDGTCNLHADKPQMCKSVPFDPMLPEPMQGTMLEQFTEYGCMTQTEEALPEDLIFNGGRIVSGDYKNHYEARLSAMKRDVPALIPLIALLGDGDAPGSIGLPSLAYFLQIARSGAWIETSMMPLLMLLVVRLKQVTAQRARDYAAAQVRLIGSAIDAALKGRNKNYRDRTNMMRRYLGQYDALDKVLS